MATGQQVFATVRLVVRQFTNGDAEIFYALNGNAEVMRYIRPVMTRAASDAFLKENLTLYDKAPGCGRWAVFAQTDGAFVGTFSILPLTDTSELHIGYLVLPAYQRQGLASELLQQGLHYFFATHSHPHVVAITDSANVVSENMLFRTGFIADGQMHDKGEILNRFVFPRTKLVL